MNIQKANPILHALLVFFTLAACTPPPAPTAAATTEAAQVSTGTQASRPVATSLTFLAEADAEVSESEPEKNAGDATSMHIDGPSGRLEEGFLRFTVRGVAGPIYRARLRLYDVENESEDGPAVYAVDSTWSESEITWSNRPARIGPELDNQGSIGMNTWVEYDVTAAISGNGTFSFVLTADSSDGATFSSRQGARPPELVITLADGPTATAPAATPTAPPITVAAPVDPTGPAASLIFTAEADARVRESRPKTNYGDGTTLQVDGDSTIESFIRFTVTGVFEPIKSARLRLYVTDNGTANGPAVYAAENAWNENEITWSNRPARTSEAVDNKDRLGTNGWVDYDVTPLVTDNGTFSFVLAPDSSDAVAFSSRQGEQPPQLIITTLSGDAPAATPTGANGEAILVGAGDISECDSDNDELTAQLLDAIPGTVFTTGDNAYNSGTPQQFADCYGPTWGRHKDRTRPVPGNHEYRTTDAAGYFQYFNNIPSYYAYDLGSWRIYALNSEIDVTAESEQVAWLQQDLAANPRQCVLAYWHRPRWSSGIHHGSNNYYQTLWQILYEAGAELVINGHEHHYERFAEMDASGKPVKPGLRQIVAGMGGRDLYEFGRPTLGSQVRNASTYGVLKVTLRADGYDWEFIPVPGSTFTDSGSTDCH